MNFKIDKQTLEDLGLNGKYKSNSIYALFAKYIKTFGGEKLFNEMYNLPITDLDVLNTRTAVFDFFQEHNLDFPFSGGQIKIMEDYVLVDIKSGKSANTVYWGIKMIQKIVLRDEQFEEFGVKQRATIQAVKTFKKWIGNIRVGKSGVYSNEIEDLNKILNNKKLDTFLALKDAESISFIDFVKADFFFRKSFSREMKYVLDKLYELDLYLAVGKAAVEHKFSYAKALSEGNSKLLIHGLRHPLISDGIANDIILDQEQNLIFLTGANMAGKSTLMKSIGISLYLAHIGFPIAAKYMEFSIMDGLYTSINVSDNLNLGYSHYYSEVLRVKKAAEEVASGKKMLVIFDELFKGTNVKDAYDATLAVTKAFSQYNSCFFIISTHIVEVAEELCNINSIKFRYLPTIMVNGSPKYTYLLANGVSADRHGMMIIEKEGIINMIRSLN